MLADRLTALGGAIHRNIAAASVTQDGDRRNGSTLATPDGPHTVTARYVVGGGRHAQRRALLHRHRLRGRQLRRLLRPRRRAHAVVARRREVSLFFAPEGMVVVAPLPDGSFRIVAELARRARGPRPRRHSGADRRPRADRRHQPGRGGALELALPPAPSPRQRLPHRPPSPRRRRGARAQPRRRPGHEHRHRRRRRARRDARRGRRRAADPTPGSTATAPCAGPRPRRCWRSPAG